MSATHRRLAAACLLLPFGQVHAQLPSRPVLNLDAAMQVAELARAQAQRLGAPGAAIAVVDAGGHLVFLERLDNTFAAGSRISTGKARTAALFKKPTKAFEDAINGGRTAMAALDDFTPLQGGVPIVVDGQVIGAVGVSGAASAQQDTEIAEAAASAASQLLASGRTDTSANFTAGVAAATASPDPTGTHVFSARQVREAFAGGKPLLETGQYRIVASRREAAGEAEIHARETDVFYIVSGRAELVTGGQLVGAHTLNADEQRGASIAGGESRSLAPGDVVLIARNTPHWFKSVSAPLLYFTVKPIAAATDVGGGR